MILLVSCVEDKAPYRAHPNKLIGRNCTNGVCKMEVKENVNMTAVFQNLGVHCVKKDKVAESLDQRRKMKIDPFKQGFQNNPTSFNLNTIRLCFQAFLMVPDCQPIPATPVVSDVIFDQKTYGDLTIIDYAPNWSLTTRKTHILILCEKVSKSDIEVHFEYTDKSKLGLALLQACHFFLTF